MTRLKVKINREYPPIETIRQYQDFGGLMQCHKMYYSTAGIRHMLYNDRKKLIYIVLIIIFLLLLLFADDVSAQAFIM